MDINKLTAVITILVTLSIATERLVEIVRGIWSKTPWAKPASETAEETKDAWEKARVSLLAIGCGIVTAFLASPILAGIFKSLFPDDSACKLNEIFGMTAGGTCGFALDTNGIFLVIALGLLTSGGSSLWNSILEYLVKIKDLKKSEVKRSEALREIEVERARLRLENARARRPLPE
jgi:hypothetical protein